MNAATLDVTLPDGSIRTLPAGSTALDLAKSIGSRLAKAALAAVVDGNEVDISVPLSNGAQVAIITADSDEGRHVLRHSTAHVLAQAVLQHFPGAKFTIGPAIEDGFYYDFELPDNKTFSDNDLEAITERMRAIVKADQPFVRAEMSAAEALALFADQPYKREIIERVTTGAADGSDASEVSGDGSVSVYRNSDTFVDLCRGPHVPSTGRLTHFALMKVAGAYWRGNSNNEMLQRIYGTAWTKKEDLAAYLHRLEEAEKRDHRKLGKQLDLFHMQDEAPGLVFWHPKGWALWQQVEQYMRKVYVDGGYQEIRCPQILDRKLWEKSGHWDNYKENMFTTESEKRDYALKPMNCPGHIEVFKSDLRSYRDLPMRYGEFGACHRNESSGALHGIMRVRGFTQDDGHIFCTEDQVQEEVTRFNQVAMQVYADFGFNEINVKLALRPEARLGTDETWDKAEDSLRAALKACGVQWTELPGEGAFYGPKIEYHMKDSIGRSWQCGTIQVDFQLPGRLGAEYVAEDNSRRVPVMLHRAIVGSMERFIGILIENHAGAMPLWLSPVQVVVATITEAHNEYAHNVVQMLKKQGIRVEADLRNEKINRKIREHTMQKTPYIAVIGDAERDANQVAVRLRGNENLGSLPVDQFVQRLLGEINSRA